MQPPECNDGRHRRDKETRGVERKVEREPWLERERRDDEGWPESCKRYERGRKRVRETEGKEGKDKRGGRELWISWQHCHSIRRACKAGAVPTPPPLSLYHHLRQRLPHRHRCYTTALPPSPAVAGANPTRLPCFTIVFRIIYRIDRCG